MRPADKRLALLLLSALPLLLGFGDCGDDPAPTPASAGSQDGAAPGTPDGQPGPIEAGTEPDPVVPPDNPIPGWQRVAVGMYGGIVKSMAMSTDGVLYAGSIGGLWRSTDQMASWKRVTSGGRDFDYVDALAVEPGGQHAVWVSSLGRLLRSADGETFDSVTGASGTGRLVPDPVTAGTVYIAQSSSITKTVDSGAHWSSLYSGFDQTVQLADVAVNPTNSLHLVACGGINHAAVAYYSVDGGAHWTKSDGVAGIYDAFSVRFDPFDGKTIYLGGGFNGAGTLKSTDGGASFTAIPEARCDISEMAFRSSTNFFVGCGSTAGIYEATAAGWTSRLMTGARTRGLFIDPQRSSTLYTGVDSGPFGLFRSDNGGTDWSPANVGFDAATVVDIATDGDGRIFAAADQGLFASNDRAQSWRKLGGGIADRDLIAVAVDPSSSKHLLAMTTSTIFQSADRGEHWSSFALTYPGGLVSARIVFDPKSPSRAYAATAGGVLKTVDGGLTWTPSTQGIAEQPVDIAIHPVETETLYASTTGFGDVKPKVYRSTNAGASWEPVAEGLTSTYGAGRLAINAAGMAYVATPDGLFSRAASAATWTPVLTGPVRAVALDPTHDATLYASDENYGVQKSDDGGAHWSKTADGFTRVGSTVLVTSLVVDPKTPTTIYAGTFGSGAWKNTAAGQ